MSRKFNITGICRPGLHYMVNPEKRLTQIKQLIDDGAYFSVNRARQYGKTTTLRALEDSLRDEYSVIYMSFQRMSSAAYETEYAFAKAFASAFVQVVRNKRKNVRWLKENEIAALENAVKEELNLMVLFNLLSDLCATADRPVVLIIDEVDKATNNEVFLDFLGQLRELYLDREDTPTFQSVILAGVYNIRKLKRKIRPDDEHKDNSPWNIAADFDVVMSFSMEEISDMLAEYEADYRTGMDVELMSELLYDYTSGYPFLVSYLCKTIDEKIAGSEAYPTKSSAWSKTGFLDAVKLLLGEKNSLFESLINNLNRFPELNSMLYSLLFTGTEIPYNPDSHVLDIALMFGFVRVVKGSVTVANRIFETRLYNLFLTDNGVQSSEIYKAALKDKNQFIRYGHLDMELILKRFVVHFNDLYGDCSETFLEEDGRRYFLLYLRPIINGTGNYYVESQTRNMRRTDVIVDYLGEQFIIEMKVWHGSEYNARGEKQLLDYLDYYQLQKGYMLSFNFNKKKEVGVKRLVLQDKILIEAVV